MAAFDQTVIIPEALPLKLLTLKFNEDDKTVSIGFAEPGLRQLVHTRLNWDEFTELRNFISTLYNQHNLD